MLNNNNLFICATFLAFVACDSKSEEKVAPTKSVAQPSDSEVKAPTPPTPKVAATLVLEDTDVTEAAKKNIPGFSGTLSMKLPKAAEFSQGGGYMDVKQGDFALAIGSGFKVAEEKEKLAKSTLTTDVKYIVDEKDGILYSGKMMDQKGFFVVVDTPAFGGLKSSCRTGMIGTTTEQAARQVLEACQSLKYSKK